MGRGADLHHAVARGQPLDRPATAKTTDISLRSVQRIWHAYQLQARRIRTFKRLARSQLCHQVRRIVGLFVDPPAHAVVLQEANVGTALSR
jgi:hypothetical protein